MKLYDQDESIIAEHLGLPDQEASVLHRFLAADTGAVLRTSDIMSHLDFSRQYVSRLLGSLERRGLLDKSGSGPRAGYTLNERAIVDAYMATDRLLRADKPFRMEAIADYDPGVTRFLPAAASERFQRWSDEALRMGDTLNATVSRRFLIDFAWASSKLEGNTYSLLDTRELLEGGVQAEGKPAADAQMIRNHASAIEFIIEHARDINIRPSDIRSVHALLSRNLLGNPQDEGRIRQSIVEINRSVYRPPAFPQVLDEGLTTICDKARQITNPYEQSMFLLVQIAYLQPFIDVNKRTARVFSNVPLLRAGLAPLSFFGMDDEAYIGGLMAYYETNSPVLIASAYEGGYRASVDRFRTYRARLSEDIDTYDRERHEAAEKLVKRFVIAVANGTTTPDASSSFLRNEMSETDPLARDSLYVTASRMLRDMDSTSAIKLGLTPRTFSIYKQIQARFDAPAQDGYTMDDALSSTASDDNDTPSP